MKDIRRIREVSLNSFLEFADLRAYVIIQIIKDPTYWGIVAGWILIMIGLTVKYFPSVK